MMLNMNERLAQHLKGFVFPQIPLNDWISTHKMEVHGIECPNCTHMLYPSTPIASKLDRGVVYGPCSCGDLPPVTLVSASPKEREEDVIFFNLLSKALK